MECHAILEILYHLMLKCYSQSYHKDERNRCPLLTLLFLSNGNSGINPKKCLLLLIDHVWMQAWIWRGLLLALNKWIKNSLFLSRLPNCFRSPAKTILKPPYGLCLSRWRRFVKTSWMDWFLFAPSILKFKNYNLDTAS